MTEPLYNMAESFNGKVTTRKLFKQYSKDGTQDLDEWRRVFVECGDPTEHAAALALVGDWRLWQKFKSSWGMFADTILPQWHAELDVQLRSQAIKDMAQSAKAGNSTAARWLAEGKYRQRAPGRPSSAEIERNAKIENDIASNADEEIARVQLAVSND